MSEILVYSGTYIKEPFNSQNLADFELKEWSPRVDSLIPKGKPFKYVIYSLFYFLRIFGNQSYREWSLVHENRKVAKLLVIPPYYKYGFMKKNDVQIAYVITDEEYRGKGLSHSLIFKAIQKTRESIEIDTIWYVTNEGNTSSIRLAEKCGFTLRGFGNYKGKLFKSMDLI